MVVNVANFDLTKKAEVVDRFLLTKGLRQAPVMRVGAALDVSGSMGNIIQRGDLQLAFNQLMGISYKFDDNGELDVFKFNSQCTEVGTCSPRDYEDFVRRRGISAGGGTSYAPVVEAATKFFYPAGAGAGPVAAPAKGLLSMFSKAPAAAAPAPVAGKVPPALMLIVTDGDAPDGAAAERALRAAERLPIYFQFVGVGRADFPTIKYLADALPNVGDVYLRDFKLPDEEVYGQIISDELVEFLGKHA